MAAKTVFDHGNHGTCPNLFGGQFMSYDDVFYDHVDEGFMPEPASWVPIHELPTDDIWVWADNALTEDESYAEQFDQSLENSSYRNRKATGFDYVNFTPGGTFIYDRDVYDETRTDEYFLLLDDSMNDESESASVMMKGAEAVAQREQDGEAYFEVEPAAPAFFGNNRVGRGTTPWQVVDERDVKTYLGRRRGKGLQRAPKWQQEAGGRRQARQGLREKRIVLNAD